MGMSVPSQREPRASGLYRVVTRSSPLSASGRSNAQKSQRVTLSRFVERLSTKWRRSSFEVMLFVSSSSKRSRSRSCLNSSSRRFRSLSSSRSLASICFWASMSVAVPNQVRAVPDSSRSGWILQRNQRNTPSWRRSRVSNSPAFSAATISSQVSISFGKSSGCTAACQPWPRPPLVPV